MLSSIVVPLFETDHEDKGLFSPLCVSRRRFVAFPVLQGLLYARTSSSALPIHAVQSTQNRSRTRTLQYPYPPTINTLLSASSMPTFDDTWISPHISIPSTGPGADHNYLGWPTSPLTICCLCGDTFHAEKNPADNRTQRPCHDLSCPECTWLQRNQNLTCQKCAARFPCPSRERTSLSSEVDPLPIPSHRVGGPNDDGYDGDDERGAISNFQSPCAGACAS